MRLGIRLAIALSAAIWLTVAARAAQMPAGTPAVASQAPALAAAPTARASSDYLGSPSCARCHEKEQRQWEASLHIKMTKPIAQAVVLGDFTNGTRFADHGRSYEFGRRNNRPFITIASADRKRETFQVDYTLGAKRYQGYLSILPDGRIYVLPAFWHVESRRWVDWKDITPLPDTNHDLRQIWNTNCFNCHATNILQGFDVKTQKFASTWTEMGIGCEACHGPGREHVELATGWEKNPASKPAYDSSDGNRQLSSLLKTLSTRSSEPRRVFDTCGYCHGNKQNLYTGFRPGDRYDDYALPFLPSGEALDYDPQGEYWPDGRPSRFNRTQALMQSGCFMAGAATCTSCHVVHTQNNPFALKVDITKGEAGDTLCTQCHTAPKYAGTGLEEHTHHATASEGSRCINCHMSDVNWRLLVRRRDHTFKAPVPEVTTAYGVPNGCTSCHDDKPPEWAAAEMDKWWNDGARRQGTLRVANLLYRAGSGDTAVLPDLARLALDRRQGPIVRAASMEYVSKMLFGATAASRNTQSQTSFVGADAPGASVRAAQSVGRPAVTSELVNMLIGAAADPEPIVRAFAVGAMAATGQREKVLAPLTARLIDQSRIVRARAAEELMNLGVVELPGAAGLALARAQDEFAAAMRTFPDVTANTAALAWLEMERGRVVEASRALDDAIAVSPRYARPYVLKGVIAARAGRFSEAIELWKKARSIEPTYQNIDQLIAEAEKRK
jgi:predicted CXXCH cytochrome family protein